MALTACRECAKEVSTEAAACPHCGAAAPARARSEEWTPLPEVRQRKHAANRSRPDGMHPLRLWELLALDLAPS